MAAGPADRSEARPAWRCAGSASAASGAARFLPERDGGLLSPGMRRRHDACALHPCIRRLKSQVATDLPPKKEVLVFCGMSELQAKLYRGILEKDLEAVLGKTTQKSRLMNMVMQLRKVMREGNNTRGMSWLGVDRGMGGWR